MSWHLAQINVARFIAPQDDPANADFMAALDHVNAMADAAPGFVWRLVRARMQPKHDFTSLKTVTFGDASAISSNSMSALWSAGLSAPQPRTPGSR